MCVFPTVGILADLREDNRLEKVDRYTKHLFKRYIFLERSWNPTGFKKSRNIRCVIALTFAAVRINWGACTADWGVSEYHFADPRALRQVHR